MEAAKKAVLDQISAALAKAEEYAIYYENRDYLDPGQAQLGPEAVTVCASTIERLTPASSSYRRYANQTLSNQGYAYTS